MKIRTFLILAFAILIISSSSCKKQAVQPNIILFLADDMGYGDPQCYMPNSKIPTPNIELMLGKKAGIEAGDNQIHEALVHHSGNGKFAIRQGKWKMIPQLGSGGWTEPRFIDAENSEIKGQLYDIYADPEEKNNLWLEHPDVVERLQKLLTKYQEEGRSTGLRN